MLKAIQINVIADENQPDRVLEAYTFTVNYNDLKATDREIRGLQLGLPNDAQMICANEEDISAATFLRKSADRFVTSVNAKIFPRKTTLPMQKARLINLLRGPIYHSSSPLHRWL